LVNSNELAFGSSPLLANTDGDPHDDYQEWVADTDPASSNDYFRISGISNGPPLTVFFRSSSNRQYTLRYAANLISAVWSNMPGQGPRHGAGGSDRISDTNPPSPARFYRLTVEIPPR